MKRLSLLSLFCVVTVSLVAGCSDSASPAAGGAMMNDGVMKSDAMMKDGMKSDGMMQGDSMMKDDMKGEGMKGDGMMKGEGMMKEENK
jgi:pentapeptide MXKDX repeat protein